MQRTICIALVLLIVAAVVVAPRFQRFIQKRYIRHSTLPSKQAGSLLNGNFEQNALGWEGVGGQLPFKIRVAIDHEQAHSGRASLKIDNRDPRRPGTYATVAQIAPAHFQTRYQISLWLKAVNVEYAGLQIATNLNWVNMVQCPTGTYDWTNLSFEVNSGWRNFVPFRLVSENQGMIWVDDVEIRQSSR